MKTVKEVSELLDVSKQTIHYHLKSLPSNLKVNKVNNKSLIDDNTIDYLKTILNKKTTKESTKFDEKSTNKTESLNNQYSSYNKYIEHLESEIRQKNRQIDDLTIALKQEQSLNLNSQNILSNTKKIETDNIDSKEDDIITPKASKKNEQKQSIFSKLFKKIMYLKA
jgi:hypothetical protein